MVEGNMDRWSQKSLSDEKYKYFLLAIHIDPGLELLTESVGGIAGRYSSDDEAPQDCVGGLSLSPLVSLI